ncbi:hypothetical protein RO3G_02456 [Lichtheimia corymbifera JMRC:FSU:9682]|uniref:Yeast cell wall synthesis Kre9/Knh1-like N-terminal domain-containing protein n=1 Tax=Lichtheimia corymbifera JMRC:FSU:9682 TaxID=1263082 RepID=A0A068RF10_9FUNG|nr:hypothetical protein RO3G_02456 [Lichtheimia corymbifera JMRC:FSU:9682]
MKSIVAAIAALAVSTISAQSTGILSVTSPIEGTTYTAGKDALITWTNPTVDTISQIVLAHGDPNNLQRLDVIASNVDAGAGSYTWSIPANTTAGTDYALIFGTSPDLGFSPQFTIEAATGSSSASSSTAASSGSASVASSSAIASSSAVPSSASSSALPSSSAVASGSSSSSIPSSSISSSESSSAANPEETNPENASAKSHPATMVALGLGFSAAIALLS